MLVEPLSGCFIYDRCLIFVAKVSLDTFLNKSFVIYNALIMRNMWDVIA